MIVTPKGRRCEPGGARSATTRRDRAITDPSQGARMIAAPLISLSDDDLVARFRAGDDAAFTEIHRRFRSQLVAFARRMLRGSGHDAEDVVQDAFIRAYRGLRVTDRAMALRPWLYMIVRNRALDELRTPQRSDCYDDTAGLIAVPAN